MTDTDKTKKQLIEELEQLRISVNDLVSKAKAKKDSEESYKEIVFSTQDAIILFDLTTKRIIDINKAAEKMYGYNREQFLKLTHNDITVEQTASDNSMKEIESKLTMHIPVRYHKKKDGTIFPVEISGSFVPFHTGQKAACGIIRDISERKLAMDKLQKSESKYKTLLENLPQKIFFKDKDSVYISCNRNYADDLGIKADEIAGRTDYEFYPKELADKYRVDDKRLIAQGKVEEIDEKYLKEGHEIWVHTVKTPVMDENGHVAGILGIFWETTKPRRLP